MEGWVKLHRKFNDWEWKTSPKHIAVFIDLLINANHKDRKYRGDIVKKGQLTTSYDAISKRTGVSIQSIRTVLKDLKSTNEVTHKSTRHYSIITICNWDNYQDTNRPSNNEVTTYQQATNKLLTTNKNDKNVKNERIKTIIDYLNKKSGKNYRAGASKTSSLITSRLNENYTLDDFKHVIDVKTQEWINTDMEKYLRPETLFSGKFEGYLNENITSTQTPYEQAGELLAKYL
jgi:uncharacterized phage protein (TIGR02220 family)